MSRLLALALLAFLIAGVAPAAEVPERVRPFVDTVERCERYDKLSLSAAWKQVYLESFEAEKTSDGVKIAPATEAIPGVMVLKHVDEAGGAILFDASIKGKGLLQVGPTVSGEFALEMRAKTVSARLNDLSLVTDATDHGPGFQFGGFENTRNVLWTGPIDGAARTEQSVDGDNSVHIQPNTWHVVRLEVTRAEMVGYVDGKLIARGKVTPDYDFSLQRQPMAYVYASTAMIDEFKVEVRELVQAADLDKLWREAFMIKTRDQAMADLNALAGMLNDPDWKTRESASSLLSQAGRLAIEPLKHVAARGPLEGQDRARALLKQLGETVPDAE